MPITKRNETIHILMADLGIDEGNEATASLKKYIEDLRRENGILNRRLDQLYNARENLGKACPFGERCVKCDHSCHALKTYAKLLEEDSP